MSEGADLGPHLGNMGQTGLTLLPFLSPPFPPRSGT